MAVRTVRTSPNIEVPPLPQRSSRSWERGYVAGVFAVDAVAAVLGGLVAYAVTQAVHGDASAAYVAASALLPLAWMAAVAIAGGYDRRFLGNGPSEFQSVAIGAFGVAATIGFVSWVTAAQISRGFVLVALPTTLLITLLARYGLRKWVHRRRNQGEFVHRTVVVGPTSGARDLAQRLQASPHHGYQVLGACTPNPGDEEHERSDLPVLGTFDRIVDVVRVLQADTVAVVSSPEMSGESLRRLSWDLEQTGATLVVAPALVEVAGPRMSVRPVDGLPLLHLEHPRFSGLRRILKNVYDPVVAAAALIALSPLLLVVALAVRLDSSGPALYKQTRVGRLGKEFTIVKFRTMFTDAEQRKHEIAHLNQGAGPLFKARSDPRVTRVGAFLRRTSLDELPQLINVVLGEMSLVGPRPHLPEEVTLFGTDFCRRLFVKPGLTGLWQISGRSDLTWEESVRLDLRYVENWTLTWDLYIIWKTISVVARRSGAY